MATAGSQNTSDEDTTSEGEDIDQCIDDDWFVATKLQQLEDDLPSIDDQPGTSSRQKAKSPGALCIASSESASTSTPATHFDATILQRTPRIKSTPLSMMFVRDLLMKKHGVEKEAAQAAVRSRGCDIDLCLYWIQRSSFNFTLFEEKSMEFEFKCGLITEAERMEWTVRHLTTTHGVVKEVARATVLIKGCEHFGECKKYAMNPDEKILSILDPNEDFNRKIEGLRQEQNTAVRVINERRIGMPITKKSLEAYGVEENFVKASVTRKLKGFDSFVEWAVRNQYDEEKQNTLIATLSPVLRKSQKKLNLSSARNPADQAAVLILSDFMSETMAKAAVQAVGNNLDRCRMWAEENEHDQETVQRMVLQYEDPTQAAVLILSDFMSETMAKAAVQAVGNNLDRCRMWAEENEHDQETVQRMVLQYEGTRERFITIRNLVKFIANKTRMSQGIFPWRRMCYTIALLSLEATSSTDFELCLKWIKNHEKKALKEERTVDELSGSMPQILNTKEIVSDIARALFKRQMRANRYIERFSEQIVSKVIAMAAIQGTSSTDLGVCKTWLSKNASNIDEIVDLWQQFRRKRVMYLREADLDTRQMTHWDYVLLDTHEFLQISALKSEMKQKIGPGGGEISLQQCSVIFPEGALKEEKEFGMSLNNDPKQFPSFSIPITSILSCRPSMDFEKPVTVRMQTCYSAIGDAEITASLYQRKDESVTWAEVQKVTLTNRNEVQFDVMHFSDDVVGVSEGTQGEFHLINDVYIKKDTSTIASIFFVDQGAHDLATADMQSRGVVPILMKAKKIIAKMGTEIKITMECSRPDGMVATNYNDPLLKVTPDFIKKREHEIYFELDQIPQDYNGKLLIKYTLKIGEVEETLPLTTSWPIVIPEKPVLQIGNVSIDSRTSIRGNVVSAGDATTSIESHDPVYHIGSE